MNVRTLFWAALGLSSFACVDVTTRTNQDHCTFNEGDRYCAEMFEGLPFCTQGHDECSSGERYGCVAEVTPECHRPCGSLDEAECMGVGSSSTDTGTSSDSGSESSSGESSTTGPMPCIGNEDCPDAAAPFCEPGSGECVACDGTGEPDAACEELDSAAPLCVGGACVQCTAAAHEACMGKTPVCDDATNTCVPCVAHDQCGEAACNFYTGACLPADAVVHVGGAMPDFPTIAAAVISVAAEAEGTIIVHPGDYNESVNVSGGRVLAFLAAELGPGVDPPRWIRASGSTSQLTVGDATVLMDGLQVSGNASNVPPGVQVDGGRAWLDRSRIVDNNGGGIVAQAAAELTLRNCFVGGGVDVIGVEIIDASASLLYSTIGASTFGTTPALSCTTPVAVDIRNSIIVSQGGTSPDELSCAAATVVASATEAEAGAFSAGWFDDFNGGDYHLTASGMTTFADVASWSADDPLTDVDGDARPGVDGTPDYAGADVP